MKRTPIVLIALLILFFSSNIYAATIKKLIITGNVRVDNQTIKDKIKSKPGTVFELPKVDSDIKRIFKLGYFKRITVSEEPVTGGIKLIYRVYEKPSIRNILFDGNDHIKDKELLKIIDIKPYQILNREKVKRSANKIRALYASKQRFMTNVQTVIKPVKNNRADIIFKIKEAKKTYIKAVKIFGNRHISSSEIEKVMTNHRKKGWYILTWLPWFYSGRFDPNALADDRDAIRDLYLSKGFAKVKVNPINVMIDPIDGKIVLYIKIHEGNRYKVGKVSFSNELPLKNLNSQIKTKTGKIFNGVALRGDISKLVDLYGQKGYAYADINPEITFNDKKRTVNIKFVVNKGSIVKISRIQIEGNNKTEDNVIRREMKLVEGDRYNSKKIRRSKRNIINTDYFKNVKIRQVPGIKKNRMKLLVKVKEKSTGTASIGFGYSTFDKFLTRASVSEANLAGTGIHASLSGTLSAKSTQFDLNLVQPWWHNKPISVGLHLYDVKTSFSDYDDKNFGASLSVTKRYGDDYKLGASYSISVNKITVTTDNPSQVLLDNSGDFIKSAITPFASHDSRDIYIYPTKGNKEDLSIELAGLGGNMKFIKPAFDSRIYKSIGGSFVLMGRFYAETISAIGGTKLPLSEKLYMGGIDDFRGATYAKIAPRDSNGDLIGGTKKVLGSVELHFPIMSALHFYGKLFYDVGDVWGSGTKISLKQAIGPGFTWFSPIGPIDIAIGKDISPKKGQPSSAFNFSFGTTF